MMKYRTVKKQIVKILAASAAGRYRVLGHQVQSKHADGVKDSNRLVQVYFQDGQFPKNSGNMSTDKAHDITLEIELTASAAAHGDIDRLNDPNISPADAATIITNIKEASETADCLIDDLTDIVWNILMDASNLDLQLPIGFITNRWIDRIQKDVLLDKGDLVVKTVSMKYNCRVNEQVIGDVPFTPDTVTFDSQITADTSGDMIGTETINQNT